LALVLDTGPILASLDLADPDHEACARLITEADEVLVVPVLVLSEVDYWCERRLGTDVWLTFIDDVIAGAYRVEAPTRADLGRCRELQARYADFPLGVVDASVLAVVERLGETKLATLDRRHFAAVRPEHTQALELLP
jgi:predicted nucleic acid-binding protein